MEIRNNYQWRNRIYNISKHHLFAVSQYTKNVLLKFGVNEKRITITYNGVNRKKFPHSVKRNNELRDLFSFNENSFVIITIGHMNGTKGHDMVVKAVYNLK